MTEGKTAALAVTLNALSGVAFATYLGKEAQDMLTAAPECDAVVMYLGQPAFVVLHSTLDRQ